MGVAQNSKVKSYLLLPCLKVIDVIVSLQCKLKIAAKQIRYIVGTIFSHPAVPWPSLTENRCPFSSSNPVVFCPVQQAAHDRYWNRCCLPNLTHYWLFWLFLNHHYKQTKRLLKWYNLYTNITHGAFSTRIQEPHVLRCIVNVKQHRQRTITFF